MKYFKDVFILIDQIIYEFIFLIQVQTYGGSIRTRAESLERLEQQASNVDQPDSGASGRAVQNAYSFL